VLREIHKNFDPAYDFIMIPKVPLDTLDFTSYKMNLGSKMVIDATRRQENRKQSSANDVASQYSNEAAKSLLNKLQSFDSRILDSNLIEGTLLVVKVSGDGREVVSKLVKSPDSARSASGTGGIGPKIIAAVSEDVNIHNREEYIWGIFTRFDAERDITFTEEKLVGISPVYRGKMGIDATWKTGYPEPLVMREDIVKRVDEKWEEYWK
jgi:4-hydroxy-3-polyprenylbenzoate decarboxylase